MITPTFSFGYDEQIQIRGQRISIQSENNNIDIIADKELSNLHFLRDIKTDSLKYFLKV